MIKEGLVLPRDKAIPSQRGEIHRTIFTFSRKIASSPDSLVGFLSYHTDLPSLFLFVGHVVDLVPHRMGSPRSTANSGGIPGESKQWNFTSLGSDKANRMFFPSKHSLKSVLLPQSPAFSLLL